MKLSQRHGIYQIDQTNDMASFKRRLQRQSVGFGMLTNLSGVSPDHGEFDHRVIEHYTNRSHRIRSRAFRQFFGKLIGEASLKITALAGQAWASFRSRQQERKEIHKLLTLSDRYLDDIGLDRSGVELLLQNNGGADELIRTRQSVKLSNDSRLRLVENAKPNPRACNTFGDDMDRAA